MSITQNQAKAIIKKAVNSYSRIKNDARISDGIRTEANVIATVFGSAEVMSILNSTAAIPASHPYLIKLAAAIAQVASSSGEAAAEPIIFKCHQSFYEHSFKTPFSDDPETELLSNGMQCAKILIGTVTLADIFDHGDRPFLDTTEEEYREYIGSGKIPESWYLMAESPTFQQQQF